MITAAAGAALLAAVSQPWQAFPAAALAGVGVAIAWPAQDALLSRLAAAAEQPAVFALRHLMLNVGLGIGAAVAAFTVDASRPGTFVTLYLLDAASFAVAALALLTMTAPPVSASPGERSGRQGYRELLADRAFLRVWVLAAALFTVGYGAFQVAFPAVAVGPGGQSAAVVGVAYAANTITVVVVQLGVLRLLAGCRHSTTIGWGAAAWAGTWVLVLVGGWAGTGGGWFVAAAITFAVGETLLTPTLPSIVNELAPEQLRGRYNGGLTLAYTTGFVVGPLLCGLALGGATGPGPLCLALIGGCGLCVVLAARLERRMPASTHLAPPSADPAAPTGELAAVTS